MTNLPSFDLFGLKISLFDRQDLVHYIDAVVEQKEKRICFGYSLGYLALFREFPGLYEKCNAYDLMVTDGRFFYWYAKLFGAPLKYDISIPFLSELMMKRASEKSYSLLILGSTEETNRLATDRVAQMYPGARVYPGITGGNFSESDQLEAVRYINEHRPDFLFIGASTPKKEDFATRWRDKLDVRFIVPFGGMIDGLAGKVKLTPPLVKKLGLASFVRVAQEPKRLFSKNVHMFSEFFLKLLPITLYHRVIRGRKNFNLVDEYLGK